MLGAERAFCCAGCEAVARTIVEGGFQRYYETRTAAGVRPQDLPPAEIYDDPLAQKQFAASLGEHRRSATLILDRIRCAACLWLNERRLRSLPGVMRADVNYATRRAQVEWDERETRLSRLLEAIRAIGYDAYPYDPRRQGALEQSERRSAQWRLFVAGFGAMQVMMYAVPAYLDEGATLTPDTAALLRWASFALTLPVVLFSCGPFFSSAWRELRLRRIGLDLPIALGIAAGFGASAWATVSGAGEVYFDSIAMLVFLLLGARYAELAARQRAVRGLDRLARWMPEFGQRLKGETTERIPAHLLETGDRVLVAAGERVPADGVVESGRSSADESLVTGESLPVAKAPGSALTGGSCNMEQPLVMRVTRAGTDTLAAGIARLVERAAAGKPALVDRADRIAHALTYAVIAAALAGWFWSRDPWVAVAVLVVTCPCALAMAAPITLSAALGRLLEHGVALTRGAALDPLSRATDVVLDKTGTLTSGRLTLARVTVLGALGASECLALARALEASSRHPIARAFGDEEGVAPAPDAVNHPGAGVEARIAGRRLRIGNEAFCAQLAGPRSAADTPQGAGVWLADESGWMAHFVLEDPLRPEAAPALEQLREAGLRLHLLSGDQPAAVQALARRLGIDLVAAGVTPQEKFAYVARLQSEGRVVAMVGDGLNDAPVLARADVSVGMGGGSDLAQANSDVVLLGDRLDALPESLAEARRAMRVIRQNFLWALAYNAIALPLAVAGWIGPWEAAIGMAASSFLVVLNALRAAAGRPRGDSWKASTSSFLSQSRSYS